MERAATPGTEDETDRRLYRRCAAFFLAHHLLFSLFCLLALPFPAPFDEHGHLSYALHLLQGDTWLPEFDRMFLADLNDPGGWTDRLNYINHPPLYYWLMARLAEPLVADRNAMVVSLRLANLALSIMALGAVLAVAVRAGWSKPGRLCFMVLAGMTPLLPVLGGLITNDNLAFLGGALCCLGVFALLEDGRSRTAWLLAAGGVLLAAAAKLTAALLCGGLMSAAVVLMVLRDGPAAVRSQGMLLALPLCLLALLPYLHFWWHFGSPAPVTAGQAEILMIRADELGWANQRLGLAAYVLHFFQSLLVYWPPATAITPAAQALLVLPALILLLAVAGFIQAGCMVMRGSRDPLAGFVLCGALALLGTLAIHLFFAYERHVATGWLKGIYPRYYIPLLPIIPAACVLVVERLRTNGFQTALAAGLGSLAIAYAMLNLSAAQL